MPPGAKPSSNSRPLEPCSIGCCLRKDSGIAHVEIPALVATSCACSVPVAKASEWRETGGQRAANGQNTVCAGAPSKEDRIRHPRPLMIGGRDIVATCTASLQPPHSLGRASNHQIQTSTPSQAQLLHFSRPHPPVAAVRHSGRFQNHPLHPTLTLTLTATEFARQQTWPSS